MTILNLLVSFMDEQVAQFSNISFFSLVEAAFYLQQNPGFLDELSIFVYFGKGCVCLCVSVSVISSVCVSVILSVSVSVISSVNIFGYSETYKHSKHFIYKHTEYAEYTN